MFPIPDAWTGFYLFCFVFGLIFVLLSFFLGFGHDATHLDGGGGHIDVGHVDAAGIDHAGGLEAGHPGTFEVNGNGTVAGGHAPARSPGTEVSPFNLSTIMAFVTWFGGAGYLLQVYGGIPGTIAVLGAVLAGLVGGAIVFFLLAKVLLPGQRLLNPADYRMVGTVARVSSPILPGGTGEIVYSKGGSRRSDGARSADDRSIERGTEVVVVRYEKGLAFVEPWSEFIAKG